jgi:hypothetical protein
MRLVVIVQCQPSNLQPLMCCWLPYRQDHWRAQQLHASEPAIEIWKKGLRRVGWIKKTKKKDADLPDSLWRGWNIHIHIHSSVSLRMNDLDGALPSVRRTDAIGARPPALPLRARTCVGYGVRQWAARLYSLGNSLTGYTYTSSVFVLVILFVKHNLLLSGDCSSVVCMFVDGCNIGKKK